MRRRWILIGPALLSLVLLLAVWSTVRSGLSAHEEAPAMEASLARAMRRWATPAELRDERNPLGLTPQVLAGARAHWADHCAVCHGNDGKGETAIGGRLYPRAPDMTLPATQSLSDGELFAVIENGIRLTGMPGWGTGTAESGYESWSLVHFVRHLPRLTPREIAEMEALNPKTPAEWEQLQAEGAFPAGEAGPARPGPAEDHHSMTQHEH